MMLRGGFTERSYKRGLIVTKVVNLDDYREAYQIIGASGLIYTIPERYLIDLANGSGDIETASHDVLRGIVRELLIDLGVNPSEFGE